MDDRHDATFEGSESGASDDWCPYEEIKHEDQADEAPEGGWLDRMMSQIERWQADNVRNHEAMIFGILVTAQLFFVMGLFRMILVILIALGVTLVISGRLNPLFEQGLASVRGLFGGGSRHKES